MLIMRGALPTQPVRVLNYKRFIVLERLRHEVTRPMFGAEVKNGWNYTPIPPICLHGEHRDYFTFIVSYLDVKKST
jgi:hypothetical protein